MQSRIRILGHPVHPMVVAVPMVLFPVLLGLDILWSLTGDDAFWRVGSWIGMAGVAGGIAAILTGTIDLAAIPAGGRPHRIAFWHLVGGLTVHSLFICTVWARWPVGSDPTASLVPLTFALDAAGFVGILVQGFLGGELRTRHHIGVPTVEEGAQPVPLKAKAP